MIVGAAVGLAGTAQAQAASVQAKVTVYEHESGEMIVKLKQVPGLHAEAATLSSLRRALGAISILEVKPFVTDKQLQVVRIANDSELNRAMETLKGEPSVEYAEPNYVLHTLDAGTPNDPDFSKTWGLSNSGQRDCTNAPGATDCLGGGTVGKANADIGVMPLWQQGITGSKSILVAVIDTGIQWDHPDLQANVFTNSAEVAGDGIDNDGNGFIDDVHGWNFNGKNNNSMDDNEHGSHCSGTIGGVGNNGKGVAGVNWNVSLLPVKFLSGTGSGSLADAVDAINYARIMHANIMSNSWGGGGFSQTMYDAIKAARDAGILFVAAAGNDGTSNDATPSYPASYDLDNVLSVAATDNQDKIAFFSNFGVNKVHVAAPGVNVYSTIKGSGYALLSGTSMAAPHVAGVAALLMSANSTLTYRDIKSRLIATSDPIKGLRTKVTAKGRINAYNAYMNIVPPTHEPDPSLWRDQANSTESVHPYLSNANQTFTINSPGAKFIRVVFEKVDTEKNYDKVTVQSATGEVADTVTGQAAGYTSEYVEGDTVVLKLTSDGTVNGWGFKVAKIQIIAGP